MFCSGQTAGKVQDQVGCDDERAAGRLLTAEHRLRCFARQMLSMRQMNCFKQESAKQKMGYTQHTFIFTSRRNFVNYIISNFSDYVFSI